MGVPTAVRGGLSFGGPSREEFFGGGGLPRLCWPAQRLLCWRFHPDPRLKALQAHESGEGCLRGHPIQPPPSQKGLS